MASVLLPHQGTCCQLAEAAAAAVAAAAVPHECVCWLCVLPVAVRHRDAPAAASTAPATLRS
jgi:hypothetical protein